MRMEWRGAEEPREARLKVPTTATRHGVDRRWRPLCLCTASGGPHSGRTRSSPAGQAAYVLAGAVEKRWRRSDVLLVSGAALAICVGTVLADLS